MDDPKDDPTDDPMDYHRFSIFLGVDVSSESLFVIGGLSESRFKASAKGTPHPGRRL